MKTFIAISMIIAASFTGLSAASAGDSEISIYAPYNLVGQSDAFADN